MTFYFHFIGATVLSVALFTACHSSHSHDEADDEHANTDTAAHNDGSGLIHFSTEQAKAAKIITYIVQPTDFAEVTEVSGRILPAPGDEQTISATMSGIVRFASLQLTEGNAVTAGQTLFVVDAANMADGNPAAAAATELEAARQAYERTMRLAKENIVSQREADEARTRYETAKSASKSLGSAARTRSFAPGLSGYVKRLLVRPGDYVEAGQALAVIAQSRRLQLRADVPERLYSRLATVHSAHFRTAYDDKDCVYAIEELGGKLLSKGKASNETDYFVSVTFEFDNRGAIVAGSFAQVYLLGNTRTNVLCVPNEALTEAQGLTFVYVKKGTDEYERREVKLGSTDGRRTQIVSGIAKGETIVSQGAAYIRLAASSGAVPEGHHH